MSSFKLKVLSDQRVRMVTTKNGVSTEQELRLGDCPDIDLPEGTTVTLTALPQIAEEVVEATE